MERRDVRPDHRKYNKRKGFWDRFAVDAEFNALYKLRDKGEECVIERIEEDKTNATQPVKKEISEKEEELRKRKGDAKEAEGWIESAAEESLEEKVERMMVNPLYVLNPMPTQNQRKAQKTLQNSMKLLEDVTNRQRSLERKIQQFCELRKQKECN